MGFVSRDRGAGKFVNIKKGQFAYKNGDEYVLTDDALVGHLVGISIVDDEYQGTKFRKLCLKIDDGQEAYQLQMKMESGYANAFCMIIQNADLTKPIAFQAWFEVKDGKNKCGMFLNQGGKALKWYYTRDNPKDLPQLEKHLFRGKDLWDNQKQQQFLENMLMNVIAPQLVHPVLAGPLSQAGQPTTSGARSSSPAADITEPIDDLPF